LSQEKHVPPIPVTAALPSVSAGDLLKFYPLVMEILHALSTGSGTFSTNSPIGRLYVRVQKTPFPD
jgi:hypothetical protein